MKQNEQTRKLIIMHYKQYPKLQIQDIFKFLYQSSFGCEHWVSSVETVVSNICAEYESISHKSQPTVEPLDGEYSRVHLSYLNSGLRAETLGKLFCLSSKRESEGKTNLTKKLSVAMELVREKALPFQEDEFHAAMKDWEAQGYPAIHHSDIFNREYSLSYRIIANEYLPFLPLFKELDVRLEQGRVNLAIEGGSASGKTTLSKILSEVYDCTVFHIDDFFLRPEQRTSERYEEIGGNIDRERFLMEVLQPLSKGEIIDYRKFDCSSMTVNHSAFLTPKQLNVIEGVYSMHPEFVKYYHFSVFLCVSDEMQKERIRNRNTLQLAKRFFNEWIPMENRYFKETSVKTRCNLCIKV